MLADRKSRASRLLKGFGGTVKRAREQVVQLEGRGTTPVKAMMPFTPASKKVLSLSLREAVTSGSRVVTPEYLLCGLLRVDEGIAVRVLLDLNADPTDVREPLTPLLQVPNPPGPPLPRASAPRPVIVSSDSGWTTGFTLESLGRDFEDLHSTIVRIAGRGERPTVGQMPFTAAAQCAVELARRRGRSAAVELRRDRARAARSARPARRRTCRRCRAAGSDGAAGHDPTDRETVERFVPARKGGLSWMLRRAPGVEFRGVRGAGWLDILPLQAEAHLRRLLIRAGAVAMDDGRTRFR